MGVVANITDAYNVMRGEKRTFVFTVTQDDLVTPVVNGIGAWTLLWVIRQHGDDANPPVIQKTLGLGLTILNPTTCTVQAVIDRADTLSLPPGAYTHTLWRTDGTEDAVLSYGTLTLLLPTEQP